MRKSQQNIGFLLQRLSSMDQRVYLIMHADKVRCLDPTIAAVSEWGARVGVDPQLTFLFIPLRSGSGGHVMANSKPNCKPIANPISATASGEVFLEIVAV